MIGNVFCCKYCKKHINLDKESGNIFTAESKPIIQESDIIWKRTDHVLDIDWAQINYEFKNWETPWQKFGWTEATKCFFLAFIGLI